jgi:Icc-related predicted phosphoesterase
MATPVRIAAAGDVHCSEANREETAEAFARLAGKADVLLLAGDLTTHGESEQAQVLIDACAPLDMPVYAVLGNHDWHVDRGEELVAQLEAGGIRVLERDHATLSLGGTEIGIAGLKGFVGGFAGSHLPDFGEPLLRRVYAETSDDVTALDESLKAIAHCAVRVVLLHYSPSADTLEGEPGGIWTMLGTDRLAAPIAEHEPDLVLHGHAHAGTFEGRIGEVPVYNVSVPVLKQAFWVFELAGAAVPAVH